PLFLFCLTHDDASRTRAGKQVCPRPSPVAGGCRCADPLPPDPQPMGFIHEPALCGQGDGPDVDARAERPFFRAGTVYASVLPADIPDPPAAGGMDPPRPESLFCCLCG